MVHLVRKKKGRRYYLAIQRSIYSNGKRSTKHVAYLGPEHKLTAKQIEEQLDKYQK
ncbi:MAG: hypothetical protein KKE05_05775 [Nanoarchaeota archaeon]|nr:hypothetical protein [Nanoarchaeota archaeon]